MISRNRGTLPLLSLLLILSSCGSRAEPHAVMLWSADEEALPTGSIVLVEHVSELQGKTKVKALASDAASSVVDTWRLAMFESLDDAELYSTERDAWIRTFAVCLRQALPVRAKAERNADTVYRLREGETVKIIDRLPEPSDEAGLVDYWYEIMTETGMIGWTFGLNLRLGVGTQGAMAGGNNQSTVDIMALLQQGVWRPDYYQTMLDRKQYDLASFQAAIGFFVDPLSKTYRLQLADYRVEGSYTRIHAPDPSKPRVFLVEGSDVSLELTEPETMVVRYKKEKGEEASVTMLDIRTSIGELVAQETARRRAEARLLEGSWEHPEMGTLTITGNRFQYEAREEGVRWFPENLGNTGRVEVDRFGDPSLVPGFDRGLTLVFDGAGAASAQSFLYRSGPGQLELVAAGQDTFERALQVKAARATVQVLIKK